MEEQSFNKYRKQEINELLRDKNFLELNEKEGNES